MADIGSVALRDSLTHSLRFTEVSSQLPAFIFSFFSLPTGSYPAASGLPYRLTVCSFKTVLTAASLFLYISDASPWQSWRCSFRIPGSDSGYKQKQCSLSLTAGQSALWREVLQLSAGKWCTSGWHVLGSAGKVQLLEYLWSRTISKTISKFFWEVDKSA